MMPHDMISKEEDPRQEEKSCQNNRATHESSDSLARALPFETFTEQKISSSCDDQGTNVKNSIVNGLSSDNNETKVNTFRSQTTTASNLFSLDPTVGVAVKLGSKAGALRVNHDLRPSLLRKASVGDLHALKPSLLRKASVGDFRESALPARRRDSFQRAWDHDTEFSSTPAGSTGPTCIHTTTTSKTMYRDDLEANEPHPLLEFPPLFFLIKKWPWLLRSIKMLYLCRWRVSYPLQRRVPGSRWLGKIGVHFTWGEVILILPFFAMLLIGTLWTFLYPSVSITGQVSRLPLLFAFVTAMHNSVLTLLLGIPFERTIMYHKMAGRIAFINGIFHTYVAFLYPDDDNDATPSGEYAQVRFGNYLVYNMENISGTVILALVTGILITSFPYVRRKFFEVFYYVHVIFAAAMAACAFYHSGILVPIAVGASWGVDLILRKLIMAMARYPRTAQTRIISNSVVELRLPKIKGLDFNPGQYVYLCVPEISLLEWHPFSISSSPMQKIVTLHVRKVGNWTSRLHELAQTKENISILLEGPFGSVGVDLMSNRYSMVMLISGGIGITPLQSICNQLIYEHSISKRCLKKLTFVWMERDPIVLSDIEVVRRSSRFHFKSTLDDACSVISDLEKGMNRSCDNFPMSIASTFLAHVPQTLPDGPESDVVYLQDFSDDSDDKQQRRRRGSVLSTISDVPSSIVRRLSLGNSSEKKPVEHTCNERPYTNKEPSMLSLDCLSDRPVMDDKVEEEFEDVETIVDSSYNRNPGTKPIDILDMNVYLTTKDPHSCFANLPFVHEGRPDLKRKFLQIRQEALAAGVQYVAVCVCAPTTIVTICQKACAKYSDNRVQFDIHSEVFG